MEEVTVENIKQVDLWLQITLVVVTTIYTAGTLFMWNTTRRSLNISEEQLGLLKQQIIDQNKEQAGNLERETIQRHRELFSSIISTPRLLEVFSTETGIKDEVLMKKFLATLLTNHARVIFHDYSNNPSLNNEMQAFKFDFAELMNFDFMKDHWLHVKQFHPTNFREFTEAILKEHCQK